MARIAQIVPYFGKWPEWFDLYLYSCSRNSMIDFIFYTDCDVPDQVYANTKFVKTTLYNYCSLVSRKLGINYSLSKAYKLTDLKPFLGLIHESELCGYEWWGFGDIDLIYGDMSMIVNEKNLNKYNLLTTHNYHIAGHCTFVRNNEYFKTLCLKIKDWQTRLIADEHFALDEGEWSTLVFPHIKWPLSIYHYLLRRICKCSFNWFMNLSNRLINPQQHFIEYHTSPAPRNGERWIYNVMQSKIFSPKGIELPYLHFLFFKKTQWLNSETYWEEGFYRINKPIKNHNYIYIYNYAIEGN